MGWHWENKGNGIKGSPRQALNPQSSGSLPFYDHSRQDHVLLAARLLHISLFLSSVATCMSLRLTCLWHSMNHQLDVSVHLAHRTGWIHTAARSCLQGGARTLSIKENGRSLKTECKPSWKKSRAQIISGLLSLTFKALKAQEIPVRKPRLTLKSSIYMGSWLRESASERHERLGMISPSQLFPLEVVSESLRQCEKEKVSQGAELKTIPKAPLNQQQRRWRDGVSSAYGVGTERQKHV